MLKQVRNIASVLGAAAVTLVACAHQSQPVSKECTACPPQKQCASTEDMEELVAVRQRTGRNMTHWNNSIKKPLPGEPVGKKHLSS
ncbi:MAG: hypothetical protein JXX29_19510 [Deltaproteobacteria bacterium]|nr:hypothetical protein [Deltaproteobacteria bacterium]MBN2673877.1 hypothetical protein [Deltaproteobacteria bacterium]